MRPATLNKCGYQPFSRQHGTSLLEALIAILLMTIVGLAITYNLAKGTLQQGKLNAQISALNEIRGEVQSSGMNSNCTTTNSSTNTTIKLSTANSSAQSTLTRSCTLTQLSVTVSATTKTVLLPSVSYSVTDSRLGASSLLLQN